MLQVLAAAGVASRRKAEEIIVSRRVAVNGVVVTVPHARVDPSRDVVSSSPPTIGFGVIGWKELALWVLSSIRLWTSDHNHAQSQFGTIMRA